MSESNSILSVFADMNRNKDESVKQPKLRGSETEYDGSPDTGVIGGEKINLAQETPRIKGNFNVGENKVSYSISNIKPNVNPGYTDEEIADKIASRGSDFERVAKQAMAGTTSMIKAFADKNGYNEKKGINPGNIDLKSFGDHGDFYSSVNDKVNKSLLYNDSFINNQVDYDKSGNVKSIGKNVIERTSSKIANSFTSSFEGAVSGALNSIGLNITGSDYPFKGREAMFGSLAFEPGTTSRYAVVIEEPDKSECSADAINLQINNKITISQPSHEVTDGSNPLSAFATKFLTSLVGSSYPTCSPYKDIYSSGWVPCTGFSLDYGRIVSESLGVTQEYQFELPTMGVIAPALTTEIIEDNQQSVRRWLKDYMEFMSPYPGFVRPYKSCCCKITILTYNKQWSRDPGDVTDSVMNLLSLGNSQNKTNNFLKYIFYAYPSAVVAYQTSPVMNIDTVTIQWNVVGEKNTTTNILSNLVNKFI